MSYPTRALSVLSILTALPLILALAACGESHTVDVDGGSLPDAETDADVPDTGGGIVMDGGFVDATRPDSGGGIVTDGGVIDATGPDSGGGIVDGGGPADSGSGTVTCGTMTCDTTTEQCCVARDGMGTTSTCIPAGDMCMGAAVDCDGPEDCTGSDLCCATGGFTGGLTVSCVAADMCGGFTGFELCHDPGDCTDAADMCCPIMRGGISASYCGARCFGGGAP
ncbi:MAG: hypothetical protein JRH11_05795 [Deltaproteobacteria bacterium]|nr:hypothetical protein [Deltaproteobacteria bacterium]